LENAKAAELKHNSTVALYSAKEAKACGAADIASTELEKVRAMYEAANGMYSKTAAATDVGESKEAVEAADKNLRAALQAIAVEDDKILKAQAGIDLAVNDLQQAIDKLNALNSELRSSIGTRQEGLVDAVHAQATIVARLTDAVKTAQARLSEAITNRSNMLKALKVMDKVAVQARREYLLAATGLATSQAKVQQYHAKVLQWEGTSKTLGVACDQAKGLESGRGGGTKIEAGGRRRRNGGEARATVVRGCGATLGCFG